MRPPESVKDMLRYIEPCARTAMFYEVKTQVAATIRVDLMVYSCVVLDDYSSSRKGMSVGL